MLLVSAAISLSFAELWVDEGEMLSAIVDWVGRPFNSSALILGVIHGLVARPLCWKAAMLLVVLGEMLFIASVAHMLLGTALPRIVV